MPDEDYNFGGSLVLNFRKLLRHLQPKKAVRWALLLPAVLYPRSNLSTYAFSTNKKFLVRSRPTGMWSLALTENARAWLNFPGFLYESLYKRQGQVFLFCYGVPCAFRSIRIFGPFPTHHIVLARAFDSEKFPRLSTHEAKIELHWQTFAGFSDLLGTCDIHLKR